MPRCHPSASCTASLRHPHAHARLQHVAHAHVHDRLVHSVTPVLMLQALPPGCQDCRQHTAAGKVVCLRLCMLLPVSLSYHCSPGAQQPAAAQRPASCIQPVSCICCMHTPGLQDCSLLPAAPSLMSCLEGRTCGSCFMLQDAESAPHQAMGAEASRGIVHCMYQAPHTAGGRNDVG